MASTSSREHDDDTCSAEAITCMVCKSQNDHAALFDIFTCFCLAQRLFRMVNAKFQKCYLTSGSYLCENCLEYLETLEELENYRNQFVSNFLESCTVEPQAAAPDGHLHVQTDDQKVAASIICASVVGKEPVMFPGRLKRSLPNGMLEMPTAASFQMRSDNRNMHNETSSVDPVTLPSIVPTDSAHDCGKCYRILWPSKNDLRNQEGSRKHKRILDDNDWQLLKKVTLKRCCGTTKYVASPLVFKKSPNGLKSPSKPTAQAVIKAENVLVDNEDKAARSLDLDSHGVGDDHEIDLTEDSNDSVEVINARATSEDGRKLADPTFKAEKTDKQLDDSLNENMIEDVVEAFLRMDRTPPKDPLVKMESLRMSPGQKRTRPEDTNLDDTQPCKRKDSSLTTTTTTFAHATEINSTIYLNSVRTVGTQTGSLIAVDDKHRSKSLLFGALTASELMKSTNRRILNRIPILRKHRLTSLAPKTTPRSMCTLPGVSQTTTISQVTTSTASALPFSQTVAHQLLVTGGPQQLTAANAQPLVLISSGCIPASRFVTPQVVNIPKDRIRTLKDTLKAAAKPVHIAPKPYIQPNINSTL